MNNGAAKIAGVPLIVKLLSMNTPNISGQGHLASFIDGAANVKLA